MSGLVQKESVNLVTDVLVIGVDLQEHGQL